MFVLAHEDIILFCIDFWEDHIGVPIVVLSFLFFSNDLMILYISTLDCYILILLIFIVIGVIHTVYLGEVAL